MIPNFLEYQRANKGLADSTINNYRKDLRAFVEYAKPLGLRWSTITRHDLDNYVSFMREQYQPRTIKRRVEVLRLLYTWAIHQGLLEQNPAQYTQTPKFNQDLPKAADESAVLSYLESTPMNRTSMLVHVVVALILDTGMRIGEVLSLDGRDIDTATQSIKVKGKGRKERIVYYGQNFEKYAHIVSQRQGRIFDTPDITLRFMMANEIPGCHPHAIRHLFAVRQLNRGMDLKTLGTLMGHKHVTTTEIYAQMRNERTRAIYQSIN